MIKSMTGYGKAEQETGRGQITVEIRSVNHRYGEIFVKLPRAFLAFEHEVKKAAGERLKRGKIEVFVQYEELTGGGSAPKVNLPLAQAYHDALKGLKDELGLDGPITLQLIASQRDVLVTAAETTTDSLLEDLLSAVRSAVDSLEIMRRTEGSALLADIVSRRTVLESLMVRIAERAPRVVEEYAARLRDRLSQLLGDTGLDEGRLLQEVAILADRSDITEELVRFRSHLAQYDEILKSCEPVGRKLDFLIQEMNREVNTTGSKANDPEIAALVVELKAELEKIREQVQNIE